MIDDQAFYDKNPPLVIKSADECNGFLQAAFSDEELARLSQYLDEETAASLVGTKPDIRDLPQSYLELLMISDGGGIEIGEREIGYFDKQSIRDYLIDYQFPVYLPGSLPFGLNGGGVFYIFDMRKPATAGEFPILAAESGNLCYDDAPMIAESLEQLLTEPTNIEDYL